jgi:MFS family permease
MILLPIAVSRTGSATHIGLIMALIGAGPSRPACGARWRTNSIQRAIFATGTVACALAFGGFAGAPAIAVWALLALLLGVGTAAANTVANLFIVEGHPPAERDQRFGWLQTVYNAGVVAGLLLAGLLTRLSLRFDFLLAGAVTLAAAALGWLTTPPAVTASPRAHVLRAAEWLYSTPQRLIHYPTLRTLRHSSTR